MQKKTMKLKCPRTDVGNNKKVEEMGTHYRLYNAPPLSLVDKHNNPDDRNYLDSNQIEEIQDRIEAIRRANIKAKILEVLGNL